VVRCASAACSFRREAVYECIHRCLSVGTGALINVEATFSGIKIVQRVDAHGAAAEEARQGPCVLKVAVETATEDTGNGRVFRVNFGHCHGVATIGEGPGEQYTDIAPIGLGKAVAAAQKGALKLGTRRLAISRYELVWRIVMDGTPTRGLERQQRVRSGRLAAPFVEAVGDYMALYAKARKSGKLAVKEVEW